MYILDLLEQFLGPLNNTFGKLFLSVGVIGALTIALSIFGLPKTIIFLSAIASVLMFAAFGWLPGWLIIVIGIGLFTLAFSSIRGGSNNA